MHLGNLFALFLDRRDKGYRNGRDNRGPSSRGGRGRGGERKSDNGPFVKRGAGQQRGSSEQNHSDVYRMDTIIYDDQRSVNVSFVGLVGGISFYF